MSELDVLRRLGDQIVPPAFDALRETARRRSRRTATVTIVVTAAAAVVIGSAQFELIDHRSAPQPTPQPDVDDSRPLTYAEGATVHYGDLSVPMPDVVAELDLTDDGVAIRTEDGRIWFTDGSGVERIGALGSPAPSFDPTALAGGGSPDVAFGSAAGFVVSPNDGSLVGWLEFAEPRQPQVVVYDTSSGAERLRQPVELDQGSSALLTSLTDEAVYLDIDPVAFEDPGSVGRIDLATGGQSRLSPEQDAAEGREPPPGTPQSLLVSHQEGGGPPYQVDDGIHMQMGFNHAGRIAPRGEQPQEVLDGPTRTPFTFAAPPGLDAPDPYPGWITQWIDDDTIVLAFRYQASTDILECHISTRACEVAGQPESVAVLPELGVQPDF